MTATRVLLLLCVISTVTRAWSARAYRTLAGAVVVLFIIDIVRPLWTPIFGCRIGTAPFVGLARWAQRADMFTMVAWPGIILVAFLATKNIPPPRRRVVVLISTVGGAWLLGAIGVAAAYPLLRAPLLFAVYGWIRLGAAFVTMATLLLRWRRPLRAELAAGILSVLAGVQVIFGPWIDVWSTWVDARTSSALRWDIAQWLSVGTWVSVLMAVEVDRWGSSTTESSGPRSGSSSASDPSSSAPADQT